MLSAGPSRPIMRRVRAMGRRSDQPSGVMSVESSNARHRPLGREAQPAIVEAIPSPTTSPMAKILLAAGGGPALDEFRNAIAGENATVLLASDGAEALARWWAEDPDLLV